MPFAALLPFLPAIAGAAGGISSIIGGRQARKDQLAAQDRANSHAGAQREQALGYLNQIPGMARQQYDPYIQAGHQAQGLANQQFNKMSANPMEYLNSLTSGYKPSEGYQFREKKALEAARNSAATGGLSGTNYDQASQAELVNGILGQDIQQYLQNVLGIQGTGLAGQQHEADRGYNASGQLADTLANTLSSQAGIFHGASQFNQLAGLQAGRNGADAQKNVSSGIGALLGSLGSLGGVGESTAGKYANNRSRPTVPPLSTGTVPNQIGRNGVQFPWPLRRGG